MTMLFCRHIGDLGNVKEVNGEVHTWFTDRMIKLQGKNNIMDKSVVVGCSLSQTTPVSTVYCVMLCRVERTID